MSTRKGPRSCSDRDLARVGVKMTGLSNIMLTCMKCGQKWSPMLQSGGRMPRGYWKCPNGCNTDGKRL